LGGGLLNDNHGLRAEQGLKVVGEASRNDQAAVIVNNGFVNGIEYSKYRSASVVGVASGVLGQGLLSNGFAEGLRGDLDHDASKVGVITNEVPTIASPADHSFKLQDVAFFKSDAVW
jgi:hypothetical protein